MIRLEELLANPPQLHVGAAGDCTLYGVSGEVLWFLDRVVSPGARTLETGAGLSTLVLAMKGADHHCVVPDNGLVERIRDYGSRVGIPTEEVSFHIGRSEDLLPRMDLGQLDLILIDGRHAFPTPFMDWYYASRALRPGGMLIVDDTQLWTGEVLRRFLLEEPEWELTEDYRPRTAVFTLRQRGSADKWWYQQPYVVRMSRRLARMGLPRKWLRKLLSRSPRGWSL